MFYNHYFQVEITCDDGLETWSEGYATEFGIDRKTRLSWRELIAAVEKDAMDQALVDGFKPVSAKVCWQEFGAACSQDLECAHKTISQLLELIRDEGSWQMSEDADQIAKEFGYKHDRIES